MKHYIVTPTAPGLYAIYDAQTGAQHTRFNIPGDLISGPVVSSDTCSITTRSNNINTTYIVKLPSGAVINRFIS